MSTAVIARSLTKDSEAEVVHLSLRSRLVRRLRSRPSLAGGLAKTSTRLRSVASARAFSAFFFFLFLFSAEGIEPLNQGLLQGRCRRRSGTSLIPSLYFFCPKSVIAFYTAKRSLKEYTLAACEISEMAVKKTCCAA